MAESALRETLNQLRRRLFVINGASGLIKALLVGIAVLLIAAWSDLVLDLPPQFRMGAWCVAGITLILTAWFLFRTTRRNGESGQIARRLDEAAAANGQIRTGADLALRSSDMKSGTPELTRDLSAMAVTRAVELSRDVPPAKVVPTRTLLRSVAATAGTGLLVAVIVALLPNVARTEWLRFTQPFDDHPPWTRLKIEVRPGDTDIVYGSGLELSATLSEPSDQRVELVFHPEGGDEDVLPMFPESNGNWRSAIARINKPASYFVRCGRARSETYRVGVITVPNIEDVTVTITPPAYTREPLFEGAVPDTGISGLPGTQVEFKVKSNRPLAGGVLLFECADGVQEIALNAVESKPTIAVGRMELSDSGRVELRVKDQDGQTSSDVFRSAVSLLRDHSPLVRFLSPRTSSYATPDAIIPVAIAAEDDYGVAGVELFRSLNQSRYLPMQFDVMQPPQQQQRVGVQLPLAAYGLQPGDEIRMFVRVADNHPGTANASESRVVSIQIIAESEMQKMKRTRDGLREMQSRYEQARRRMESVASEIQQLQEALNKAPKGSPLSKELQDKLANLAAKLAMEAGQMRRLAKSPLPYELDQKLAPELNKLADQLAAMEEALKRMAENGDMDSEEAAEQLEQLAQGLKKKRDEFQRDAVDMVDLMAVLMPFKQAEAEFVRLYQAQKALAERMQAFDGRDGEDNPELKVRMRELEEEQRAIREKLLALQETLEANIDRLPDDERLNQLRESALNFVEQLAGSGAEGEMDGAAGALAEFDGSVAYDQAKLAAEMLEELISQGQGMGQAAGESLPQFSPSLGGAMGQTMEQLLRDAGLSQKPGMQKGSGSGSGFSARRSTLQNVGLYGNNPTTQSAAQQGGSRDKRGAGSQRTYGGSDGAPPAALYDTASSLRSIGSDQSDVPLQFRRRVSRYFEKLADELEDD